MTTLGGRGPCRLGVLEPPALGGVPPIALNLSAPGIALLGAEAPDVLGSELAPFGAAPPSGSGLFLESLNEVVDADGVATGD